MTKTSLITILGHNDIKKTKAKKKILSVIKNINFTSKVGASWLNIRQIPFKASNNGVSVSIILEVLA